MNLMAGSLAGEIPRITTDRLTVLSLVLNNVCPLSCAHCYLQPPRDAEVISEESWLRFIKSALADLSPEYLCFSGKEIFASSQSARIFFMSLKLREGIQRKSERYTKIGVVTNGLLVSRYVDQLRNAPLDWCDVSVDGLPEVHDEIRGVGTFKRLAENLPWLRECLGDRLWVTITLTDPNIDSLLEQLIYLKTKYGLTQFSLGLFRPQSYTLQTLRLTGDINARLLVALRRILLHRDLAGIKLKLELDARDTSLREAFEHEGFLPTSGVLRTAHSRGTNGSTLILGAMTIPVGLWRAARVTGSGQWLAAEDLVDARSYDRYATGHITDFDCNARDLYLAGLAHRRFSDLTGGSSTAFLRDLSTAA